MTILKVFIIAMVGEALWETSKMTWQEGKLCKDRIGAIVVSLLLAFGAQVDIFKLIEIPLVIPYVGTFLSGLLISRGANFVHDLFKKIQSN